MDDLAFFTDGNDFLGKHEVYHIPHRNNALPIFVNSLYFARHTFIKH